MGVNVCEDCGGCLAAWLPEDGGDGKMTWFRGSLPYHLLHTHGKHTCMVCEKSAFLCIGCAYQKYHYCGDYNCNVAVCVECDGGTNITGNVVHALYVLFIRVTHCVIPPPCLSTSGVRKV